MLFSRFKLVPEFRDCFITSQSNVIKKLHFKTHSCKLGKKVNLVYLNKKYFEKVKQKSQTLFNVMDVEFEQDVKIETATAQLIQRALFPHPSGLNFHILLN